MSTVTTTAPAKTNNSTDALGTGRRKKSVARVRLRPGSGKITVNGREFESYFVNEQDRRQVVAPLIEADRQSAVDVIIKVNGGGLTGQSGACKMGVARALIRFDSTTEPILRQGKSLTRDSRMKERKHYGLRGARRGTQFSKR